MKGPMSRSFGAAAALLIALALCGCAAGTNSSNGPSSLHYTAADSPLTESEVGTISMFTDQFSSWGVFLDTGAIQAGDKDPNYLETGTPALITNEYSRPETIIVDNQYGTAVVFSKYVYDREDDSLDQCSYAIAVKNNTVDQRVGFSIQSGPNYGASVAIDGAPAKASYSMALGPSQWSYSHLDVYAWGEGATSTFDLSEFESMTLEGTLVLSWIEADSNQSQPDGSAEYTFTV